ncbi:ABC transporter permease [Oceanobacillus jeddahense]|uniref:ABC transporter permease n=1 Tax=Oceanobacillus jeddahense TaxID=1462527 RepID=A0ABY5K366_9BACI|nr:ABC transporter permease [Oceanobacillus jeddahense]UUI05154.1 ABC transporter permease [Oceanobacillus jeddahense]
MNRFWTIVGHTYFSRVKSKSFIITTAITLAIIIGLANLPSIIDIFSGEDESDQIAVIDESGIYMEYLQEDGISEGTGVAFEHFEGTEEEAKQSVTDEKFDGLLVITTDENNLPEGDYYANRISDTGEQIEIEQILQQLKVVVGTQEAGIDQQTLDTIYAPVTLQTEQLDDSARTAEEMNQSRGLVYVMLFILYMTVLIYGQMIATDVATEKSSRVMELLISSAPPIMHMFAKIIGIAFLGLTQIIILLGGGYFAIQANADSMAGEFFEVMGLTNNDPVIYIYAIIFFLLGYFLYATLAAMLGSLVSRIEDVNQLITPMIMVIVVAFVLAMMGLSMPDTTLITVTSYIPFFAPMIMFLRIGMLNIPFWEIALSIGILVITIALFAALAARVYKGGVLMYGKSGSLKDLKRAINLSKKE